MFKERLSSHDILLNSGSHITATLIASQTTSFNFPYVWSVKIHVLIIFLNLLVSNFFLRVYKPDYYKFRENFPEYCILRLVTTVLTWILANALMALLFNQLYGRIFTLSVIFFEFFIIFTLNLLLSLINFDPLKIKLACAESDLSEELKRSPFNRFVVNPRENKLVNYDYFIKKSLQQDNPSSDLQILGISNFINSLKEIVTEKQELSIDKDELYKNLVKNAWSAYSNGLKRILDVILSTIGLLISAPLLCVVWIIQKIVDPGPFFYKQIRTGVYGKPFYIVKVRSMRTDAESTGAVWAQHNDSRITGLGKFLRRSRFDELPQFYNVLTGDMSMVGPRPERPEFDEKLAQEIPNYFFRYMVKPGITGHAQIKYRYGASVEDASEKLQYDLYYIKNLSLLFDIKIILNTLTYFFKDSR